MFFTHHTDRASRFALTGRNQAFLVDDGWDDFTFKTMFELVVFDQEGKRIDIGAVKILSHGLLPSRVSIPETFSELGPGYCSLGQEQNYYETIAGLPGELGDEVLRGLRDCVRDPRIFLEFRNEPGFHDSLLRYVSEESVTTTFAVALKGQASLTPFQFAYDYPQRGGSDSALQITFNVNPLSMPPTNVHVVIGRNGAGKTYLLRNIASVLRQPRPRSTSPSGSLRFLPTTVVPKPPERFANLVTVTFSAFDPFLSPDTPADTEMAIRYAYVGLRKPLALPDVPLDQAPQEPQVRTKELHELAAEFRESLAKCMSGPRRHRWLDAIRTLQTDPGFQELEIPSYLENGEDPVAPISEIFNALSAGHKIVLLIVTRLVELADERTLILLDEPESHLHPPLLSSLVRVLSDLLTLRNSVAIVSTHSPVVLQEVPKSCVWVLRRSGETTKAERPEIETFGENVGVLTRGIFGLEVTNSGFHSLISSQVAGGHKDYDQVLGEFDQQLGAEARSIARMLAKDEK